MGDRIWRKILLALHKKIAHSYWLEAGCPTDNNIYRELDDWYRARREVAFMLADRMIETCLENECHDMPRVFYDYLNDISVEKYKEMKAYYIWVEDGRKLKEDKSERDKDYFMACDILNKVKKGCKTHKDICISPAMFDYINDDEKVNNVKIKRRKAHWSSLRYNDNRTNEHWGEADGYVAKFYDGVRDVLAYSSVDACFQKFDELISLLENTDKHHIANMFEFMLKCDFRVMQDNLI